MYTLEEKYDPFIAQLKESLRGTYQVLPRPVALMGCCGAVALTGWSDAELGRMSAGYHLPSMVRVLTNHPGLLYNFFNFYFNGVLPSDSSPHQVVYPMIALLMIEEGDTFEYYFSEAQMADVGFFKVPSFPTPIPKLPSRPTGVMVEYTFPLGLSTEQKNILKELYLEVRGLHYAPFISAIQTSITGYDTTRMTFGNRRILRLAGFLALLLFRGIAKDAVQLSRGVSKKLIKEHVHNLAEWPVANGYGPPCKTCIEWCASDLDKGNSHAGKMMALILTQWKNVDIEARQARSLSPRIQALLTHTLLTHTAGNGLGLLSLMYVAIETLSFTIDNLIAHTLNDMSKSSWAELQKFVATYLNMARPEKTFLWARLVNDGYFSEYAATSHPYLSGVFAGIIDSQQTIGTIREAAWFKLRKFQAERGYAWGKAVVAKISHDLWSPSFCLRLEQRNQLEKKTNTPWSLLKCGFPNEPCPQQCLEQEIPTQTPLYPFRVRLTGSVRIDGLVKQDWIREITKKIALIIACQLGSSCKEWELTSPLLFVALQKILNQNFVYSSLKTTDMTNLIYSCIDNKFLSLLSYLPETTIPTLKTVSHIWEFESPSKKTVLVSYEIKCVIETYDYRAFDLNLARGYDQFPNITLEHETVCDQIFLKCPERPLNPDNMLKLITPESGRLKKLLKNKSITPLGYSFNNSSRYIPSAPFVQE